MPKNLQNPSFMSSSYSKNEIKTFQKLLTKRVRQDQIVSTELASEIAEIAFNIQNTVSVLVDRNGKVREYYIGDLNQVKNIKAQAAREGTAQLAQLRLITANPKRKDVSESELLLMRRYHLDLLLFIHADKNSDFSRSKGHYLPFADYAQLCYLNNSEDIWKVQANNTLHKISEISLIDLLQDIEEDLASTPASLKIKRKEIVILVGVGTSEDSFAELYGLAETAGAEIAYQLKQNINKPDSRYFIGSGKITELEVLIQKYAADIVIFDGELSPAQTRNIERELGEKVKVLDRTELILDIFAQRAKSSEGKLQVELAQLKYLAPKLAGGYKALSKLGGGIGTRGPGETQLEVERRHIKERISNLEKKVKEISNIRSTQRSARKKENIPLVSLVGYTNAGKSTLFRSLTKTDVLVEDKLFATLEPTIRKIRFKQYPAFLLSDTVGFIQKLPTTLVKAFKATLEEITESELLLIILDASHPNRAEHLKVIENILEQIGVKNSTQLLVINKIDLLEENEKKALQHNISKGIFISSQTKEGFDNLIEAIANVLISASGNTTVE